MIQIRQLSSSSWVSYCYLKHFQVNVGQIIWQIYPRKLYSFH